MDDRPQQFTQGVNNAQETPSGYKPITPIEFRPTSVLDPAAASGTGLADADRQRALYGQKTPNGQSPSTASKVVQIGFKNPSINI